MSWHYLLLKIQILFFSTPTSRTFKWWCQFHQTLFSKVQNYTTGVYFINILRALFLPIFFCQKSPSQIVIREKMCNLLTYEKCTRKMLMKLTPGHNSKKLMPNFYTALYLLCPKQAAFWWYKNCRWKLHVKIVGIIDFWKRIFWTFFFKNLKFKNFLLFT
jgi:hypothetical protein